MSKGIDRGTTGINAYFVWMHWNQRLEPVRQSIVEHDRSHFWAIRKTAILTDPLRRSKRRRRVERTILRTCGSEGLFLMLKAGSWGWRLFKISSESGWSQRQRMNRRPRLALMLNGCGLLFWRGKELHRTSEGGLEPWFCYRCKSPRPNSR